MTPVPVLDAEGLAAGSAALAGVVAETPIKQLLIHETLDEPGVYAAAGIPRPAGGSEAKGRPAAAEVPVG